MSQGVECYSCLPKTAWPPTCTIVDRLPPRIKIRQGAPLELPHILVLIDDPQRTVIEPLFARKTDRSHVVL